MRTYNWEIYFIFDKLLKLLLKKAKDHYYRNFFNAHKKASKKTWDKINDLITNGKNRHSKFHLVKDENVVTDSLEIANIFNDYFLNIPVDLLSNLPRSTNDYSNLIPYNTSSLFFTPTTHNEVYTIIKSIKSKSNIDDIPLKMLKLTPIFSVGIAGLFNHIISTGLYPDQLKIATVIPIFKSGNRCDTKNYRPISLLPVLDKIFERLIIDRIMSFLIKNKIISDRQFGFISGSNTQLAIFDLLSAVVPALKDKEFAVAIFADLSRAFDCVNTELLVQKLYAYGIRGLPSSLLKSFLTNRHQLVKFDNAFSNLGHIEMGVPQGSSLGPLLFLLYLNELPRLCNTNIKCILYADDTTLVSRGSDLNLVSSYNGDV